MVAYGFIQSLPASFFVEARTLGQGSQVAQEQLPQEQLPPDAPSATAAPAQWSETGATCIACGIGITSTGFASAAEQRQHFKTDWHRYNVKRRVDKKTPLSEAEFERIIDEQSEVRILALRCTTCRVPLYTSLSCNDHAWGAVVSIADLLQPSLAVMS
jgi:hypothetical protein